MFFVSKYPRSRKCIAEAIMEFNDDTYAYIDWVLLERLDSSFSEVLPREVICFSSVNRELIMRSGASRVCFR